MEPKGLGVGVGSKSIEKAGHIEGSIILVTKLYIVFCI